MLNFQSPFPPPNPALDGWSLDGRDRQTIAEMMPYWRWFYKYYFRVRTSGWENMPPEQALIVGSHNGGLSSPDMVMMIYEWFSHQGLDRPVYGLMHPNVWKINRPLAELAVKVGALQAHPKMAIAALQAGASVLVYPGGGQDVFRPFCQRHQIYFAGRRGFIKLALRHGVTIVPAMAVGSHETLFVMADCYQQMQYLHALGMPWILGLDPVVFPIYLGLPWGLALGPLPHLPLPLTIHTHIGAPIRFSRYGAAAARDRDYVEECYYLVKNTMQQQLDDLVSRANILDFSLAS